MKKLASLTAAALAPALALASGDAGTGAAGEMQLSGSQLAMVFGALVGLGLVIWIVARFTGGGDRK
jgi:hypothetical protein